MDRLLAKPISLRSLSPMLRTRERRLPRSVESWDSPHREHQLWDLVMLMLFENQLSCCWSMLLGQSFFHAADSREAPARKCRIVRFAPSHQLHGLVILMLFENQLRLLLVHVAGQSVSMWAYNDTLLISVGLHILQPSVFKLHEIMWCRSLLSFKNTPP